MLSGIKSIFYTSAPDLLHSPRVARPCRERHPGEIRPCFANQINVRGHAPASNLRFCRDILIAIRQDFDVFANECGDRRIGGTTKLKGASSGGQLNYNSVKCIGVASVTLKSCAAAG